MVDQAAHGVAEIGRGLAGRQQHVLAIERRKRRRRGPDRRRRRRGPAEFVAKQRQVEAFKAAVGLGGAQDEGMALPGRPVRHIAGPDVAREGLRAGDLGDAIDAELHRAIGAIPGDGGEDPILEQRAERPAVQGASHTLIPATTEPLRKRRRERSPSVIAGPGCGGNLSVSMTTRSCRIPRSPTRCQRPGWAPSSCAVPSRDPPGTRRSPARGRPWAASPAGTAPARAAGPSVAPVGRDRSRSTSDHAARKRRALAEPPPHRR